MSDDDLLERASRALRDSSTPSDGELAELRVRVLESAQTRRVHKLKLVRWALPLAATFVVGTALAATTGQIERAVRAVESLWTDAPPPPKAKSTRTKRPRAVVVPRPAESSEVVAPEPAVSAPEPAASRPELEPAREREVPADAVATEQPRPRPRRKAGSQPVKEPAPAAGEAAPAPLPAQPEAEPPTPKSEDLALYREAHELHFRDRQDAAAFAAWDRYLARFPGGTFALEARYNRAICLVRLGRKVEARAALAPFARGEVAGRYRQSEAQRLLEALDE